LDVVRAVALPAADTDWRRGLGAVVAGAPARGVPFSDEVTQQSLSYEGRARSTERPEGSTTGSRRGFQTGMDTSIAALAAGVA
jgi:hypothetical protein